jgi:serine protease AprX
MTAGLPGIYSFINSLGSPLRSFFIFKGERHMNKYGKLLQSIIGLALLVGLLGTTAGPAAINPGAALQPALAALAAESPDQMVRVMVHALGNQAALIAQIEAMGGRVVQDLRIIDVLAAEMPAQAAARLAKERSVNWIVLDAPIISTGKRGGGPGSGTSTNGDLVTSLPTSTFLDTLGARTVWDMGYTGNGIGIAVIDSGVSQDRDFDKMTRMSFNPNSTTVNDVFGHGTHVAGIIGGSGRNSDGLYSGVAPDANIISLKISDENGMAYESDTVAALQWALENQKRYNIRIVNLSIQSAVEQSYHTSPMAAAAEILWFNGIVVVAATGNDTGGSFSPLNAPPGNDPFIITVGAADEQGTSVLSDDSYMAGAVYGVTQDGFSKPEIWAPGVDIISVLSDNSDWDLDYPERVIIINDDPEYFRISGTSMAAPMVSGAVAILLEAEPDLNPDQIKYRVMNAVNWVNGSPYLSIEKLLTTSTTEAANTGIEASQLLWSGEDAVTWNSGNWNSVNWNSVNWNAVNCNAVNWNAVNWNAVDWSK